MLYHFLISGILSFGLVSSLTAQNTPQAEPQISFAKEQKSHDYYVQQAELWWERVQVNLSNEDAWYHYYRACRNAQGTANWRTDFVDESPNLRLGADIVLLMEKHIPGTFTYNFVRGLRQVYIQKTVHTY